MTIRGTVASFSVHLVAGLFGLAFSAIGYITNAGGSSWPFIPSALLSAGLVLVALVGIKRAKVVLSSDHVLLAGAFRCQTAPVASVVRIEIRDRWWNYLAYGQMAAVDLSTPTARFVLDAGTHWASALSPMKQSSAAWAELGRWAREHDIPVTWR